MKKNHKRALIITGIILGILILINLNRTSENIKIQELISSGSSVLINQIHATGSPLGQSCSGDSYACEGSSLYTCTPDNTLGYIGESPPFIAPDGSTCSSSDPCEGKSQEWCDNYNSGGSHCKASDPTWCCDDAGYIICGDTEICGHSQSFCDAYLSNDPIRCNLDGSGCCDAGFVDDYTRKACCPDYAPFAVEPSSCSTSPSQTSDNFFTRNFVCDFYLFFYPNGNTGDWYKETSCSNTILRQCELNRDTHFSYWNTLGLSNQCGAECLIVGQENCGNSSNLLKCSQGGKYINMGIVKDKCGVQCLIDSDCSNIVHTFTTNPTPNEYQCINYKCSEKQRNTFFRLENNNCTEVGIYTTTQNDFPTLEECAKNIFKPYYRLRNNECNLVNLTDYEKTNNDYLTLDDCSTNIKKSNYTTILIVIISLVVVFILLVRFKIIKSKSIPKWAGG